MNADIHLANPFAIWFYLKIIENIQRAQTYLQENTKEDWRFKLQPQETTESVL